MGVFAHWPNRITALRFLGALVLFVLLALWGEADLDTVRAQPYLPAIAFWMFVLVAATDFLDGYLARRGNYVTAFGRIADPFVDKVLILGTLVLLGIAPWSREWLPGWMVVVILARELLVSAIRSYVEGEGGAFPADRWGKLKMVLQCIAVGALLWLPAYAWPPAWLAFWKHVATFFVWSALIATVGSGVSYVLKTPQVLEESRR